MFYKSFQRDNMEITIFEKNKDLVIFLSEKDDEVFVLNNGQIEKVKQEVFKEEYCFFGKRTFFLSKKFLFEYFNELSKYQEDLESANSLLNRLVGSEIFEEYDDLEVESLYSNDKGDKAFIFDKDENNVSIVELDYCGDKEIETFRKQYNKRLSTKELFYMGLICGQIGVREGIKLLSSFEKILNKEVSPLFILAIMRIIVQKKGLDKG
jgi:hypothetical protein